MKWDWRWCDKCLSWSWTDQPIAVSFAVAGTGTAFVYVGTWHPDVIVYGLLGFIAVAFGGGSIWGLWILTDPD